MTRACFYTGQPVRGGACEDCTCTDGGTGNAFEATLLDAPDEPEEGTDDGVHTP